MKKMKLVAKGDKIILVREDVFEKAYPALKALGVHLPDKKANTPGKPDSDLTVFARIVSIGPDVNKDLGYAVGDLVVFGTAAQVKFRDGSEYVITTPGGILAGIVEEEGPVASLLAEASAS